jgi:2'-5' RNA ligase
VRLFLAIDPGEECRHHIAGIVDAIRASTSGIRWVRESNFHLTLAFLGDVDETRLPEISAAAANVTAHVAPFSASIGDAGVFPDWRRIRIVWLGLRDSGPLMQLGSEMGDACGALGFPQRPFRAHLTIGRTTGPLSAEQKTRLSQALAPRRGTSYPFHVSRVLLMHSTLSSAGSQYTELATFPLGAS